MTDPRPKSASKMLHPEREPNAASPLSEERVREYEQMLAAVTPGPWMIDESHPRYAAKVYCDDALGSMVADCHAQYTTIPIAQEAANARFIAAAPTIVRDLLSDRTALTARLEAVEALLAEVATELRDDARTGELRGKRHREQAERAYELIKHRLPTADDVRGILAPAPNHPSPART